MTNIRVDRPVRITQTPVAGTDWPTLCAGLVQAARWSAQSKLIIYAESVSDCGFTESTPAGLAQWPCPDDAFEGRVFGGDADARWIRNDDGTFQAWIVKEHPSGTDDNARVTDRTYFLIGRGTKEKGVFEEARYPPSFTYPVAAEQVTTSQDARAFVLVSEYQPCMPTWLVDRPEDETTAELDQPMLLAHRFVALRTSDGSKKVSNAH